MTQQKPRKFIGYFDMTNLYGWAMSQYLPYGGFEWVGNVKSFDVRSLKENDSVGYTLEVDLKYPEELHDSHSDYPLAAEKSYVTKKRSQITVKNLLINLILLLVLLIN